jgi:chaperonin GroES
MSIDRLIKDITKVNIASDLSERELADLGQQVHEGYKADLDDPKRIEWAKNVDKYIEYAMQKTKPKSDPWPDCANIKQPILTEAAIQFNARIYPALVPSTNIVKCSTTGADEQGLKSDRADRVGKHMTYQIQEEMEEWEPDQDRLFLVTPIAGCCFKKTYQSPDLGRPVSKIVMPTNLIVKYDSPSLERAPRISEIIPFLPREVTTKIRAEEWLDVKIEYEDEEKQKLEEFVSQHTYLDIRKLGYKVPYIVTIHEKSQKIMRIVANYTEHDIWYNDGTEIVNVRSVKDKVDIRNEQIDMANMDALALNQAAQTNKKAVQLDNEPYPNFKKYKVIRVDATKYYTKYGLIPSPDGGFYDLGLGQLLGPLLDATDTLINQMLDAGSLANGQGGFLAEGITTQSGSIRAKINEFVKIKTNGQALKDAIVPFNFRGPVPTAFSLLSFLVESARSIANLKDILSGDVTPNQPATTSMIAREEGMRVYNAIYKRMYRSEKKEFKLIYDLNALYLPEETYLNVLDTPEAIKRKDYSNDMTDVRPTADPSESMQSQKIVKAEAMMALRGQPGFNDYNINKNYLEAIEISNIDEYLPPPSKEDQKPDPLLVKTIAEVEGIEAKTENTRMDTAKKESEIIKNIADAESKEDGFQLEIYKQEADIIKKKGELNAKQADATGAGPQGVETTPADRGVLPISEGTDGGSGEIEPAGNM